MRPSIDKVAIEPLLVAGRDYPRTYREFVEMFPDDNSCATYLEQLRWPNGFVCPVCQTTTTPWRQTRGRLVCPSCRHRATPLMFPCRAYTESLAYLSGGFSVLTRDQLFPPICSHTWRSSPSGSTDALHVAVDSFFVDSWNKLSLPDLLPRLTSPMVTTGLAFANLGQGGANLLPPL